MKKKEIDIQKVNEVTNLSSKVLKVLYLLLCIAAIYAVVILFKEIKIAKFLVTFLKVVFPLFIGLVIAWLFEPFVKWLESKNIKRSVGTTLTYILILFVFFLILSSLIPLLVDQIKDFIKIAPSVFDSIKNWCVDLFDYIGNNGYINADKIKGEFFAKFESIASDVTTELPTTLLNFATNVFSGIGAFVLGLIIGFFLLISFDKSFSIFNFVPKKFRKTTTDLFDQINDSLRLYVKGAAIDCAVIFVLSSIGLWLVGLKAPALFGLFCALTNIIPYAGPYIGGAPAVIVGFTQSSTIGILTLLVIAVIQFLEGNFLQPVIMSKITKLHPVTIMLGLLVFGYFFGIIGMLVSTPLIAVLKTIFTFYDKKYGLLNYTSED